MKNHHSRLRIFVASVSLLIAGNAGAQDVYSSGNMECGAVGRPITFAEEIDCVRNDPHATAYWDFGAGATPATATVPGDFEGSIVVFFAPVAVTYSTPGDKTVKLTVAQDAGSSTRMYPLHVFD